MAESLGGSRRRNENTGALRSIGLAKTQGLADVGGL